MAKFEGWTNWQTWYLHVLIGNERKSNDTAHRIVRQALDRGLKDETAQQAVARLFSKYFNGLRNQAKAEFEENAKDALKEEGEFQARQIEGRKPPPSEHGHAGDVLNEAVDLIRSDMGSGPIRQWKEPNWLEMATWGVEEEKLQRRSAEAAARKKVKPGEPTELPDDVKNGLKEMGIKGSKRV